MADSLRYKDWYMKAQTDLQSAKILFKHDGDYAIVAFHCQQSIEKALKGFILKQTDEIKEGHSLVYLCKRAGILDEAFKKHLKECAFVNQFYIETRYPGDILLEIDEEEAKECIDIAQKILTQFEA